MMDGAGDGRFASWPQWGSDELLANTANGHVGTRLVEESVARAGVAPDAATGERCRSIAMCSTISGR